jgi:hypothetical protein
MFCGRHLSNPKSEVADMIDEDPDWIPFHAAVTYVEATLQCYRERAAELVVQAADNLTLKSRTVQSSPRWIVSDIAGVEAYHSDGGNRVEVCRHDLLKLWPESQKGTTRSAPAKIGSNAAQRPRQSISDCVRLTINRLWPDGFPEDLMMKERDERVKEWVKHNYKRTVSSRTIQRVLKADREGV